MIMLVLRLRRPRCSIIHLVCMFTKMHLLVLLQDDWVDLVHAQVVCMCEEYNSVLSTPTEPDKIRRFGRYIGKPKYWSGHLSLLRTTDSVLKKRQGNLEASPLNKVRE